MYELRISFKTLSELQAFINKSSTTEFEVKSDPAQLELPLVKKEPGTDKAARKKKLFEKTEVSSDPKPEPTGTKTPEPEKAPEPTLDDVRAALGKVSESAGSEAAIKLVKSFGASRVSELKTDQYACFIDACSKAA